MLPAGCSHLLHRLTDPSRLKQRALHCKLRFITPKFSNRQVLFPGKLIIYTDGLVEAVNPEKQPYSKERLRLISKHRK